jgi:hypothetical protein
MAANRLFFPQEALDLWMEDEKIDFDGDTLTLLSNGKQARIESAVHLTAEVAEGGDAEQLVGKVKTTEQIVEIGGDHSAGSVILGDNAYEVVEGFTAEPIGDAGSALEQLAQE